MQPGDIVWHTHREEWRMVMVLEGRYWCDCPEWVQILEDGESLWTAAALIRPIDG